MSLAILFHFLCAQHVSDINISIIRSLRLCCSITTSVVLFCKDGGFSVSVNVMVFSGVCLAWCVLGVMCAWCGVCLVCCVHGVVCAWCVVCMVWCVHGVVCVWCGVCLVWCVLGVVCAWCDVCLLWCVLSLFCSWCNKD